MTISSISTNGLLVGPRLATQRVSQDLSEAQLEVASGRKADVGLSLGATVGEAISVRAVRNEIATLLTSNAMVANRLEVTQNQLGRLQETAVGFVSDLLAMRTGTADRSILVDSAAGMSGLVRATANQTYNGAYVFGGIRTETPPMPTDIQDPGSPLRVAIEAAFVTEFGFGSASPAVSQITPAQMMAFLDGAYSDLFLDPTWGALVSAASDDTRVDRIGQMQTVRSSVSANEALFRDLTKASVAVLAVNVEALGSDAYQSVVDFSIGHANAGHNEIAGTQSRLGYVEERIARASQGLELQQSLLDRRVFELEGVDAYEATTRVLTLQTQLEASYAVTGRLQGLSLLNYI
jgi:flagellar hook-associated protein 3 FlgL